MHFLLNQLVDLAIFFVMAASATISCIMQKPCSSLAVRSLDYVRKLRISGALERFGETWGNPTLKFNIFAKMERCW